MWFVVFFCSISFALKECLFLFDRFTVPIFYFFLVLVLPVLGPGHHCLHQFPQKIQCKFLIYRFTCDVRSPGERIIIHHPALGYHTALPPAPSQPLRVCLLPRSLLAPCDLHRKQPLQPARVPSLQAYLLSPRGLFHALPPEMKPSLQRICLPAAKGVRLSSQIAPRDGDSKYPICMWTWELSSQTDPKRLQYAIPKYVIWT